jgi:hypothetical protein
MTTMAEPVVYPREAVVTIKQVAAALGVSARQVERMDLPTVYLGERTKRYVWAQILDTLAARAK